ncbi:serine hydrolase [Streptomyces albipurpureus]|uniref:Class A beta-lactamase-related serine hydrolase n=1 Tax=Streptomyces albipurpureus TaxID=2897419 RepID=A0ABT0UU78_9ACTN|nr:serine hydrolase [Streptomyces sp. CWNU-1]MCM2392133.1 class A beta-lactamase-related serine hydrolase [Streptomyces sp. CWNU-1]
MGASGSPRRGRAGAGVVVLAAGVAIGPLAAGAAEAAGAEPVVVCASSDVRLAYEMAQGVLGAVEGRSSTVAVQFDDRLTDTQCELRADRSFDSASVIKVAVLGALLRTAQNEGRALTASEKSQATAMITESDNAATTALWTQLGMTRIKRFLSSAGMMNTVPGAHGYWGLTQTTARDQGTLLRLLSTENNVLNRASRTYALRLMAEVVPSQRWGTSAGAPSTATVRLKNGWLPRSTHGWRVHSVGAFTGAEYDYTLAVLTEDNSVMADGISTIESVSRAIHRQL